MELIVVPKGCRHGCVALRGPGANVAEHGYHLVDRELVVDVSRGGVENRRDSLPPKVIQTAAARLEYIKEAGTGEGTRRDTIIKDLAEF